LLSHNSKSRKPVQKMKKDMPRAKKRRPKPGTATRRRWGKKNVWGEPARQEKNPNNGRGTPKKRGTTLTKFPIAQKREEGVKQG